VAYTVGLLHKIGMVAIDEWALRNDSDLRLTCLGFPEEAKVAEQAALGFTQADVGASLLRYWEFPHSMCEPVQWQYSPRSSAAHIRMACLLHCAKWLSSQVCESGDAHPVRLSESIMQMVPLRTAELPLLLTELKFRLKEVSSLLEINGNASPRVSSRFPAQNAKWSAAG
jgi:HD-like signal output (HDOD) protein